MGQSFRDLFVWQCSVDLAVRIIRLTAQFHARQWPLSNQMNRAAVSIASNIAEGQGRHSRKEERHFFTIARGSLLELETQLEICVRAQLIPTDVQLELSAQMQKIGAGLNRLISRLEHSST